MYAAYYDINDKYYTEIAIWTIQLALNAYFYNKFIRKQMSKFQKKLRLTIYFYFLVLTVTIILSIVVKVLKGYKVEKDDS